MPSLPGGRDAEQIIALKPRLSSYLEEFGECFVSFDLLHAALQPLIVPVRLRQNSCSVRGGTCAKCAIGSTLLRGRSLTWPCK
jgi:hypothetical protein